MATYLEILRRSLFSARHTTRSVACSLELNFTALDFGEIQGQGNLRNLIPKNNDVSVIHFQPLVFILWYDTPKSSTVCVSGFLSTLYWKTMWSRQNSVGNLYRVSQEECVRIREGVPYVKVYRYNPKHLRPKLNGYGDNGQRSLKL